jgi:hypothetical protein
MKPLSGRSLPPGARKPLLRGFQTGLLIVLALLTASLAVVSPPGRGLVGSYYLKARWAGPPNITTRERRIGLERFRREYPGRSRGSSVSWSGGLFIEAPGIYGFSTVANGYAEVRVDGQAVTVGSGAEETEELTGTIELGRGFHEILVRFSRTSGGGRFEAYWTPPGGPRRPLSSAFLFTRTS